MSEYIKQIELVQNGNSKTINIGTPHLVEVKYADFVSLINTNGLISGAWYRITDYTCTLNADMASNVKCPANAKYFDILVLALTTSVVSEECRAMRHDVSSDFTSSNLLNWKIWYTYKNDYDKYTWANANGKGVIYRMIDDFGNEAPYDFKNIMFKDSPTSSTYKFTFNHPTNNTDLSITKSCTNNVIKAYSINGRYYLNNIVITSSTNIYNNTFDDDCHDIRISNNATNNRFESECNNIQMGENCSNNLFGSNCDHIYMGDECFNNEFGEECHYVVFGHWNTNTPTSLDKLTPTAKGHFKTIRLDNTVSYISLDLATAATNPTASQYLNHIRIHGGVFGGVRSIETNGKYKYSITSAKPILPINIAKYAQSYEINISLDSDETMAMSDRLTLWYV